MSDVKFNIHLNIDGQEVLVKASTDAKNLARNLDEVAGERKGLRDMLLKFNQMGQSFQNLTNGLQQLTGVMGTYTAAYNTQVEAETRLLTVMRERMGATEDDMRAILDLTSAQQQLGVVGDEVQLMGAQQIATFATHLQTLEALIPAMNNLLVQQKGLKATGQDAVNVANMIGRALQGQYSALSRVGITMSDAEKQTIKFGTETERAAVIAQIITNNVGEMNAELAKTDAGKAQQLANTIGDWKEQMGALFAKFEPVIVAVAELGMALNALSLSGTAIAGITRMIYGLHIPTRTATVLQKLYNWHVKEFRAIAISAAMGAKTLELAFYGIRASILPLAAAFAIFEGLLFIIRKLSSSAEDAADKTRDLAGATGQLENAQEAATKAYGRARAEMDITINKLKNFKGSKEEESVLIKECNDKYGEAIGYYSSVSSWYNVLIKNSEEYCKQMEREAEIAAYTRELESLYEQKHKQEQVNKFGETLDSIRLAQAGPDAPGWLLDQQKNRREAGTSAMSTLDKRIGEVSGKITSLSQKTAHYSMPSAPNKSGSSTGGGGRNTGKTGNTGETYLAGQLGWYDQQISELNKKRLHLSDPEDVRNLDAQVASLQRAKQFIESMSEFTKEERAQFGALNEAGVSATSQVGGGSMVPEMSSQQDILESIGFSWDDVQKKAAEYFDLLKQQDAADSLQRGQDIIEKQKAKFQAATDSVNQFGGSLSNLGNALKAPELDVAGTLAQAIATMTQGYAQASAQATEIGGPWGWIAFAATGLAQLAAMISSVKNMNKFAEGGIAYGPTVGLFGEYAGAKHNPEVVAPLDRLRQLIPQAGGPVDVRVRIKERDLYGVSQKSNRYRRRMGG